MLLLAMGAAMVAASWNESPTDDEVVHLPAGISYWRRRDLRINLEHPPLLKLVGGLGALTARPRLDFSSRLWTGAVSGNYGKWCAEAFPTARAALRLLRHARPAMALLAIFAGWLVFIVGRQIGGDAGGLLALLVFATSPFFLGFGPLVDTDVGLALCVLWAAWRMGELWGRPRWRNAALLGLALAAAFLAKFSAGLLLPALAAMFLWRTRPSLRRVLAARVAAALGLAAALVYGVYFVFGWNTPLARVFSVWSGSRETARVARLAPLENLLAHHALLARVALPALLFAHGVGSVLANASRPAFLFGRHFARGVWFYFPVMFALKMTPGLLALLLLVIILALATRARARRGRRESPESEHPSRWTLRALLTVGTVFLLAAMASPLNIGVRHISAPVLIAMVLVAPIPPLLSRLGRRMRAGLAAVVVLAALSSLTTAITTYPNYLAYFNAFRGHAPKFEISGDSDLDWGQYWPAVAKFEREHHIVNPALDSEGTLAPSIFIGPYVRWRCETGPPQEAWGIVTARRMADLTVPAGSCARLLRHPHWALAGGSVFAIHIAWRGP